MVGHSVRFEKERRLKKRAAFMSHPNLNYRAASQWQLNHLNPSYKGAMHRKSRNSVYISMSNAKLAANKHVASAHKLIDGLNDDEPSFKTHLRNLLNTYNFQITFIILIIMDCMMVLGEMLIELKMFQSSECERSDLMHTMVSPATMNPADLNETMSAKLEHEHKLEEHCEHVAHILHHVEHGFHLTSIFILFLFNVELIVRLYAHGYKYFLELEIALDAFIVIVSFSLDVAFLNNRLKKFLYLLIILRLWRVLRVIHAIITAIRAPFERQVEKLKKKKKMLQRDLAKAYFYSNMLEEEIKNLRRIVEEFEYAEEINPPGSEYGEYEESDTENDKPNDSNITIRSS